MHPQPSDAEDGKTPADDSRAPACPPQETPATSDVVPTEHCERRPGKAPHQGGAVRYPRVARNGLKINTVLPMVGKLPWPACAIERATGRLLPITVRGPGPRGGAVDHVFDPKKMVRMRRRGHMTTGPRKRLTKPERAELEANKKSPPITGGYCSSRDSSDPDNGGKPCSDSDCQVCTE